MDEQSNVLFGRYQALRVYAAVGAFGKPEFSSGEITASLPMSLGALSRKNCRNLSNSVSLKTYLGVETIAAWTLMSSGRLSNN